VQHLPFGRSGRLFRGNLHTHTNRSDGGHSPEQVCASYRRQGYDFVAVTDHFLPEYGFPITDTTPFRRDDFTTLIGAELHAPALANGLAWHMVAVGLPAGFAPPGEDETGPQLAARAVDAGAFLGLAHPVWYGVTVADLESIPAAHAIEVYNAVCGSLSDRAESWFHADQLLSNGRRVTAFGADDAHFRDFALAVDQHAASPGGPIPEDTYPAGFAAWVWVQAERLDPDLLLESLKRGRYYTSQGPRIHDIAIDDDRTRVTVISSPVASVFVTGDPRVMSFAARHGTRLTETTLAIDAHRGSYCRVTVVDVDGKRAWSNPIWLD
jgi:hypothetical protein